MDIRLAFKTINDCRRKSEEHFLKCMQELTKNDKKGGGGVTKTLGCTDVMPSLTCRL